MDPMIYIGLAVAALVVIVGGVLLAKRKGGYRTPVFQRPRTNDGILFVGGAAERKARAPKPRKVKQTDGPVK